MLLARLVRLIVHATPLTLIDRTLGGVFGLVRALVLLLAVATVVSFTPAVRASSWQASHGAAWLGRAAIGFETGVAARGRAAPAGLNSPIGLTIAVRGVQSMCGIVGVIAQVPVNQLIYDALLLLQHRGQDAAGIVTMQGTQCFMHKARGMVRDVFRTRNMRALPGRVGLGQVRYPTAGNAYSEEEAQPFYVNAPFGIVLVHNGNLTNAAALKQELFDVDRRHINTEQRHRGADQRAGARDRARRARPRADARRDLRGRVGGAPARARLVRGDRADRGPRPAGLSRSVRHPPAGASAARRRRRRIRGDGGQRNGRARGHRPHVRARRGARRGGVHRRAGPRARAPVRRGAHAESVHVRVRVPGAARLGDRRRLGLPGAAEPGRDAGAAPDLDDAAARRSTS